MATNKNTHLAYRYGYCVNEKCEKSKKDAKGKYDIQQVASHKPLVCSECQKALHECPPPKSGGGIPVKLIGIVAAAILLLGGIGFGVYNLTSDDVPTTIKLDKNELAMKVGETHTITASAEPQGTKGTFIFEKKGDNIHVESSGEVTALKKGEATIYVKCKENPEISAILKIKVEEENDGTELEPQEIYVKEMSINGGDLTLAVSQNKQLSYSTVPEKHDEQIDWTSDNEAVATVDATGKVTAKGEGSATINVKADKSGKSASIKVTVSNPTQIERAEIEKYGKYTGSRAKNGKGLPDGTGKLTFTRSYQLNSEYMAQPGEYIQGIFENGKPTFVTYYQKDGTVTKIKLR